MSFYLLKGAADFRKEVWLLSSRDFEKQENFMSMNQTSKLSSLQNELELLESETFEVLDLVEAREEMLGSTTSTTSTCSSCSSSSCSSTSCG
ncbi:hypothetical protein GCM10028793_42990 [Nocardiopsis oceani]